MLSTVTYLEYGYPETVFYMAVVLLIMYFYVIWLGFENVMELIMCNKSSSLKHHSWYPDNKFIKKIIKMIFSVNGVGFVGGAILEKLPWDGNFLSWGKEYRKMGMNRLSNNMREESARQRDQGLQKLSSKDMNLGQKCD